MRLFILIMSFLMLGCTDTFIRAQAPSETLDVQTAVRASGVLHPQELYFSLVSQYNNGQARVVVLGEPTFKMLDMTITPTTTTLHQVAEKVPNRFVKAMADVVRKHFLTICPEVHISQKESGVRGTFEIDTIGGVCH